jgi:hypothetical protein
MTNQDGGKKALLRKRCQKNRRRTLHQREFVSDIHESITIVHLL